MPLHILLPIVILGITGVVLLVHMLGWSAQAALTQERVSAVWVNEYPEDKISDILIADDQKSALVWLENGDVAVVWSFGADAVVHRIVPGITKIKETADSLLFRFSDLGTPRVRVRLSQNTLADRLADLKMLLAKEKTA